MATLLSPLFAACACALAAAVACAPAHAATPVAHPKASAVLAKQAENQAGKKPAKTTSRKPSKKAKATAAAAVTTAAVVASNPLEVDEPDIMDNKVTEYACELGNKITIYTNETDTAHIALRWKTRLHRLSRIGTTTGALRFENPHYGLIWIGIPSKGILLDSKLNRQLANECKNAEQSAIVATAEPEAGKT
jgi:membrane-bound inhibitor of C-type lysozyme